MRRITIRHIAEKAGVSINTASRALNGKPDVSPETRERVLRIASELHYIPNRFARGLRSSFTGTIGVVVTDIANPFFGALVKGIEESATEKGYSIILCDTDEQTGREKAAIQLMFQEQVDGVLLTPVQEELTVVRSLKKQGFPFVLLGRYFEELQTDYVVTDDFKGGVLATEHLIEQGCRRIIHIQGPPYISSAKERLKGYLETLRRHGISGEALVTEPAITMEDGYRITGRVIRELKPDGIFAFSDFVALGVLRALREEGLRVPEDVALVGYDDVDFASYLMPPLSTVRIPKEELGRVSLDLLCKRIRGELDEPAEVKLDVELIVRDSSRPKR
ncbi:TPA: LacI family transcriptional regulator [Candidatus Poribacteria bacterium]|nr:LacI family transcriptional regulator [Candidatus Poribacteria bacterium]